MRQYEIGKRAAEFADPAVAVTDDPLIRELGSRYIQASSYLAQFIKTGQITAATREEIAAERWLDSQRAIRDRNQAISNSIVREKQRRTPVRWDLVDREICGLSGYSDKNCPLIERRRR